LTIRTIELLFEAVGDLAHFGLGLCHARTLLLDFCAHLLACLLHLVWCSVLQCVAVCCSVLQCVAARALTRLPCSSHRVPTSPSMLQYVAVCCSMLQYVAVCCSVLQCVAVCCSARSTSALISSRVCFTLIQTYI